MPSPIPGENRTISFMTVREHFTLELAKALMSNAQAEYTADQIARVAAKYADALLIELRRG